VVQVDCSFNQTISVMKFSTAAILLSLASTSVAYPFMGTPGAPRHYQEWSKENEKRQLGFNADAQRIDVSGGHAFKPPGAGDLRGPCPGLNALANHGYLPSNGEIGLDQAVSACNKVFGMVGCSDFETRATRC
jgi:hypothetical protein